MKKKAIAFNPEERRRQPSGAALHLLEIARGNPEMLAVA